MLLILVAVLADSSLTAMGGPQATATLELVDETGQPLDGFVSIVCGDTARQYATEAGRVAMTYPTATAFRVVVAAAGQRLSITYDPTREQRPPPRQIVRIKQPTRTVAGRLFGPEGTPLWDAVVAVRTVVEGGEWEAERSTRTRADGRFTLTLPPGRLRSFAATATGLAPREFELSDKSENPESEVARLLTGRFAIALRHLQPLAGRVVDDEGLPVAGASVSVVVGGRAMFSVSTDAAGHFAFADVREVTPDDDPFCLLVQHPDYAMAVISPTPATPAEVTLERGRSQRLNVVNPSGQPLADVPVSLFVKSPVGRIKLLPGGDFLDAPRTNDRGRFVGPRVPRGSALLVYEVRQPEWSVAWASSRADELTMRLFPRATLTGRVVCGVTGQPLAFATLSFDSVEGTPGRGFRREYTTDPLGRFSIGLERLERPIRARVEADGYDALRSEPFALDATTIERDFVLKRQPLVRGRVVCDRGRPVNDAHLYVCGSQQQLHIVNGEVQDARPAAATDATGTFLSPDIRPEEVIILSPSAGWLILSDKAWRAGVRVARVDGQPGERPPGDEPPPFVLTPWGSAFGRLEQRGRPVDGRRFEARHTGPGRDSDLRWIEAIATTDETGRFGFDRLMQGTLEISSRLPTRSPRGEDRGEAIDLLQVVALDSAEPVELSLVGGCEVTGRVALPQDVERGLIAHGGLSRTTGGQTVAVDRPTDGVVVRAFTLDPEGRFRCPNVRPGVYDLVLLLYEPTTLEQRFTSRQQLVVVPEVDHLDLSELPLVPVK